MYGTVPEAGTLKFTGNSYIASGVPIVKLGPGRFYRVDYDHCSGCAVCLEQCPCHAIEMTPEPVAESAAGLIGEPTMPSNFKVRP